MIETIKEKLNRYGISFETFLDKTGNLTGSVQVPAKLLTINPKLTPEKAYEYVCNKVFDACNVICYGVPGKFKKRWYESVGEEIYYLFQSAIFEEVSKRLLSNNFPEFANETNLVPANMNLQDGGYAVTDITDYINPLTKAKLDSIDWLAIDPQIQEDDQTTFVYAYANLSNLSLTPFEEKQVLMASEEGKRYLKPISEFAGKGELDYLSTTVNSNGATLANYVDKTNQLINDLRNHPPATEEYVQSMITTFPEVEEWNSSTTYNKPQFVVYNGALWFALKDNNLNKVPGGTTGEGWWSKITHVVEASKDGEIVYYAGTDIKFSYSSPNRNWYVNVAEIKDFRQEYEVFNYLNNNFSELGLRQIDVTNFLNNFCGGFSNLKSTCESLLKNTETVNFNVPVAGEEEVKLFKNSNWFSEWRSAVGWNSINYEGLPSDTFLRFAENNYTTGGNSLITDRNLPKSSYLVKVDNYPVKNKTISARNGYSGQWGGILNTSSDCKVRMFSYSYTGLTGLSNCDPFNWVGWEPYANGNNSYSFFTKAEGNLQVKLNEYSSQYKFIPEYQTVYGVKINERVNFNVNKTINFNRPNNFKCWVNIINIQNYWRGNELSLALETKYFNKDEINEKLSQKINIIGNNANNVTYALANGQLNASPHLNYEILEESVSNVNELKEQMKNVMPKDVNSWSNEQIGDLWTRLQNYGGVN